MSTIEEFESAPVGATATGPDGRRVIKTTGAICPWHTTNGTFLYDYEIVDYVLDPLPPATAREALDLAWNLAHPIKKGQVIPAGTGYLLKHGIGEPSTMRRGVGGMASARDEEVARTLDPLPDPEPDWLDAPAVIAFLKGHGGDPQVFARENKSGTQWLRDTKVYRWDELMVVTPLYPKEQDA